MRNKGFNSLLYFLLGAALLIYALLNSHNVVLNGSFPGSHALILTALGLISAGLSGLGVKWLAIPVAFLMLLGAVYFIYEMIWILAV